MSGTILSAAPVTAYKEKGGQYQSVGKLGAAIIGNPATHDFKILLYITKDKQVTHVQITPYFPFSFPRQRYACFHDVNRQGWLLLFESDLSLLEFSRYVCVARYFASVSNCLIAMDMVMGEGTVLGAGDLFELRYTAWALKGTIIGDHFDSNVGMDGLDYKPVRMRLGAGKLIRGWEQGLPGLAKGGRRLLVLPPQLAYGDKGVAGGKVAPNSVVLYDVELMWMRSAVVAVPLPLPVPAPRERHNIAADFLPYLPEPDFDEESNCLTGFPSRFADNDMSNAMTSGAKLHLLSRMAKMGQSVLPNCNIGVTLAEQLHLSHANCDVLAPSFDDAQIVAPSTCISVPPHVVRQPKATRPAAEIVPPASSSVDYYSTQVHTSSNPPSYHHSVSYPPQPPSHPSFYNNQLALYQPNEAHSSPAVAMLINESLPNTEQQWAVVSRLGEKVERMLERVESNCTSAPLMENRHLLANLQRIIEENAHAKNECAEKNEKIAELLRQNQSLIEQRDVVCTLEQEKLQLARKLAECTAEQSDLQLKLGRMSAAREAEVRLKMEASDEVIKLRAYVHELEQRNESLAQLLYMEKNNAEKRTSCLIEEMAKKSAAEEELQRPSCELLVESLRAALNERESALQRAHDDVQEVQTKNCVLREQVNALNIRTLELLREHKQAEERSLMLENKLDSEVKKVMNKVFQAIRAKIDQDVSYQGADVVVLLLQVIKSTTLEMLNVLEDEEDAVVASVPISHFKLPSKECASLSSTSTTNLETASVENKLYMMGLVGSASNMHSPSVAAPDFDDDSRLADVVETVYFSPAFEASLKKYSQVRQSVDKEMTSSKTLSMAEANYDGLPYCNANKDKVLKLDIIGTLVEDVPILGNRLEFIDCSDKPRSMEMLPSALVQQNHLSDKNDHDDDDDDDDDNDEGEYEEVAAPLPEFMASALSSRSDATTSLASRINGPSYVGEDDAPVDFGKKLNLLNTKATLSPLIDEEDENIA